MKLEKLPHNTITLAGVGGSLQIPILFCLHEFLLDGLRKGRVVLHLSGGCVDLLIHLGSCSERFGHTTRGSGLATLQYTCLDPTALQHDAGRYVFVFW